MVRSVFLSLAASLACFMFANTRILHQTVSTLGLNERVDNNDNRATASSTQHDQQQDEQSNRFLHGKFEFTVNQTQYLLETTEKTRHSHKSDSEVRRQTSNDTYMTTTATATTKLPLCQRKDIIQGQWVPTLLKRAPYVSTTTHLRCHDKSYYRQRPFPTWKWQPHNHGKTCELTSWSGDKDDNSDASHFCQVARYSTILIVGDSLSWEHYSSLVQMTTGKAIHQGFQHQSRVLNQNIVHNTCPMVVTKGNDKAKMENTVRLVYRRDDRLSNLEDAIRQTFPTVLLLNRGAHHVNDTRLLEEMEPNWIIVQKWLSQCQQEQVPCRFFWRTSVPGMPHLPFETCQQLDGCGGVDCQPRALQ